MIYKTNITNIKECLWAKIPSYYFGNKFIRLIPFKDHINIEAKSIEKYREELKDYVITPKGMLQIKVNDKLPDDILIKIFKETIKF